MILITGNAGFVGTYLTASLLKGGLKLSGIDIVPAKNTDVRQIVGNILDRNTVLEAMQDVDTVIHLAAAHKDFGITKDQYFDVNVNGTKNLLEAASNMGVKKFIFYSSVSVYGEQSPTTEETPPQPYNYYGASKLAAEQEVQKWANEDSSRTVIIIRPTVVFGIGSKANIFRLIRQVCDGPFLQVGNGENIKSIAYVENLVEATIFLLERCSQGLHIFNYADEPHYKTLDLVNLIRSLAGEKQSGFYIPLWIAVLGGYGFDVLGKLTGIDFPITASRMKKFSMSTHHQATKIRSFGFVPPYSIEEGLRKNIEWYLMEKKSKQTAL